MRTNGRLLTTRRSGKGPDTCAAQHKDAARHDHVSAPSRKSSCSREASTRGSRQPRLGYHRAHVAYRSEAKGTVACVASTAALPLQQQPALPRQQQPAFPSETAAGAVSTAAAGAALTSAARDTFTAGAVSTAGGASTAGDASTAASSAASTAAASVAFTAAGAEKTHRYSAGCGFAPYQHLGGAGDLVEPYHGVADRHLYVRVDAVIEETPDAVTNLGPINESRARTGQRMQKALI